MQPHEDAHAAAEQEVLQEAVRAIARADAAAAAHLAATVERAYQNWRTPGTMPVDADEADALGRAALLLVVGGEVRPSDLRFRALRRFTRRVLGGECR